MGNSPPQTAAAGSLFHRVQSLQDRLPQPGSRAPLSMGLPWSHSLLSDIHLLQRGLLHGLQGDLCLPHGSPCAAGAQLSHQELQGNLSTCPSFFTDLGVHRVLLTSSHSAFLWLQLQLHYNFVIYMLAQPWPAAHQRSEPPGIGSATHEGRFC